MFEKYYESPAFGEWCRRVYGKDLKQLGSVTMGELKILYREVDLPPDSHILDMGCGAGYIGVEIAGHYNSRLTAVDFDIGAISHAQRTFADNPVFNFIHGDGSEIFFESSTFDLICFCDSLHFTITIEKLHKLLDKCWVMLKPGGKMAIFRGKTPLDEIKESTGCNTQVALWGKNNNTPFKEIGKLTEPNRMFYRKAIDELLAMESKLRSEVPETFERLKSELIDAKNDNLDIPAPSERRWLYIFNKKY